MPSLYVIFSAAVVSAYLHLVLIPRCYSWSYFYFYLRIMFLLSLSLIDRSFMISVWFPLLIEGRLTGGSCSFFFYKRLSLCSQYFGIKSDIFMMRIVLFDHIDCFLHIFLIFRNVLLFINHSGLNNLVLGLLNGIGSLRFGHLAEMHLCFCTWFLVFLFVALKLCDLFLQIEDLDAYLMDFIFSSLEL